MTTTSNVVAASRSVLQSAPIVVTRPNNATAYAANQVWGDGVDARIALPVPAAPADYIYGFTFSIQIVHSRPQTDPSLTLFAMCFASQPATVLKDQDAFSIPDADIARVMWGSAGATSFTIGPQTNGSLNPAAGVAGRRLVAGGNVNWATGRVAAPGSTVYLYLRTVGVYNPAALEQLWLTPLWAYTSVPLT